MWLVWIRWKAVVKDQSPLLALPLRHCKEVHGTVPSPASPLWKVEGLQQQGFWAARVYVLSYIVILNVRFHTTCVKHQKVPDTNSWDKGMWQDIF